MHWCSTWIDLCCTWTAIPEHIHAYRFTIMFDLLLTFSRIYTYISLQFLGWTVWPDWRRQLWIIAKKQDTVFHQSSMLFFLCVCVCVCSYSLSVIFVPLENWQISPTSCWVTGDICTCSWAWDCKEPLYCCQIDDHFRKLVCKCVHVPSNTRHLFTQSFQLCSYYDIGIHSWCLIDESSSCSLNINL